ncbi:hypothetical protein PFISCL1PPCAC_6706, partial [Pristionchus fissidentatus]
RIDMNWRNAPHSITSNTSKKRRHDEDWEGGRDRPSFAPPAMCPSPEVVTLSSDDEERTGRDHRRDTLKDSGRGSSDGGMDDDGRGRRRMRWMEPVDGVESGRGRYEERNSGGMRERSRSREPLIDRRERRGAVRNLSKEFRTPMAPSHPLNDNSGLQSDQRSDDRGDTVPYQPPFAGLLASIRDSRLEPTVPRGRPAAPIAVDPRTAVTVPVGHRAAPIVIEPRPIPTVSIAGDSTVTVAPSRRDPDAPPMRIPSPCKMTCCPLIEHHKEYGAKLAEWREEMAENFDLFEKYRGIWERNNSEELKRLQEENMRMRMDNTKMNQILAANEKQIRSLETDVEFSNCELQKSNQDIMVDSSKLSMALEEKQRLVRAHAKAEEEFKEIEATLKEELEEKRKTEAQLKDKLLVLQKENDVMKVRLLMDDEELSHVKEELKESVAAFEHVHTALEKQTEELKKFKKSYGVLVGAFQEKKKETERGKEQLLALQNENDAMKVEHERVMKKKADELEQQKKDYNNLLAQFLKLTVEKKGEEIERTKSATTTDVGSAASGDSNAAPAATESAAGDKDKGTTEMVDDVELIEVVKIEEVDREENYLPERRFITVGTQQVTGGRQANADNGGGVGQNAANFDHAGAAAAEEFLHQELVDDVNEIKAESEADEDDSVLSQEL